MIILVLVWWLIGYISFICLLKLLEGEVLIKDLIKIFLPSLLLGPMYLVLLISCILERKIDWNKRIW
jgi:hypothetical protein